MEPPRLWVSLLVGITVLLLLSNGGWMLISPRTWVRSRFVKMRVPTSAQDVEKASVRMRVRATGSFILLFVCTWAYLFLRGHRPW